MRVPFLFFLPAVFSWTFPPKLVAIAKITRIANNFVPVSGLVAVASFAPAIHVNKPFMTTFGMVHALTYVSMIVNDIWDIEADRINHPTRPLVTGELTVKEAWTVALTLTAAYIGGGLQLSQRMIPYWGFPLIVIYVYTPVLKKIPLVKNISCAAVISTTVDFIRGSSCSSSSPLLRQLVFVWSMTNEILMDIADEVGDLQVGIRTLPVLYGKKRSLVGLCAFIFLNQLSLLRSPFFFVYFIYYFYLWRVHTGNKKNIRQVCRDLTFVLLGTGLLYR